MNKKNIDIENITVGVVIFDKSLRQVILKQRNAISLFPNKYGIPGGKVKVGENLISAVRRELYEEHQLIIEKFSYINLYKYQDIYLFVYSAILGENNESFVLLEDIHNLELAPNIDNAISESIEFMRYNDRILDINLLKLKQDVITRIANSIVEEKGQIGWDHFLFQNRIGIIGTAVGLEILNGSDYNKKLKENIYETLIQIQLADGGWGVKNLDNKYAITESTCICLSALYGFTRHLNDPIINAVQWIKDNRLDSGLWGYNKNSSQGRIITTCMVLNTFFELGIDSYIEETINIILECQNYDGGWGFINNSPSNLSATCFVVLTLILYRRQNDPCIINAISWIENKLKNNFVVDESEVEYIGDKRFEYKHSTHIYVLCALLKQKGIDNISPLFLYKSMINIINSRNPNGFWEHSLTPGCFPIWHTNNILKLFNLLISEAGFLNLSWVKSRFECYKFELDCIRILSTKRQISEQETIVYY